MIRVAHLSDSHFDERGRLQDVVDVHRAFLRQAEDSAVDLIVHGGDLFERRSTPTERLAAAEFLLAASEIAPVFVSKGNHDAALDLDIFPMLKQAAHPVVIADRPSALPGSATEIPMLTMGNREVTFGMLALPWFARAHLVAGLDVDVDRGQTREMTIAAARRLLTAMRHEAARLRSVGAVPILVGHVMVAGSEVSTGQTLIGTTVELSPADLLEVGAAYVALGHVHLAQEWFDGRVAYSGSPNRCNFGEKEAKGWRLVTLTDEGEFVRNDFRELPARRIELLEIDFTQPLQRAHLSDGSEIRMPESVRGALVRFRYYIDAKDLHLVDSAALERKLLAVGAVEAKVEAMVVSSTRARAPEIVKAATLTEKVDQYLDAKEIRIDGEQRARVHQKVGVLEGGAHAAV